MPNSFSSGHIDQFKREAKQLCRDHSSLAHSEALDLIARANGYSNWSLLMKHSEKPPVISNEHKAEDTLPVPFQFVRTLDEMRQAMRTIPYKRGPAEDELAKREVENICFNFVSAANAVDYAVAYMHRLLEAPRFYFTSGSKVYHEMRRWLPYFVQPTRDNKAILVNRHYKPVGLPSGDWVDYGNFPHLSLQVQKSELSLYAHWGSSPGYLFNDGNRPWRSRKDAKAYLDRLYILQTLVSRD